MVKNFLYVNYKLSEGYVNNPQQKKLSDTSPPRIIPIDPCPKCQSPQGKLGAGRKPKESSLICADCRQLIRWLSAAEAEKLGGVK